MANLLEILEARLRASRRSQDTSMIAPPQFDTSVTMQEETVMEEPESPPKAATNHMTLRDVSAIAKETETDADMTSADLSMSLLPFVATTHHSDDGQHNKSTGSTISDKTFVKTSLRPFSSEEDEDEEETDRDETMMEESVLADSTERARPLLLTADQSIRLGDGRSSRQEKFSLTNRSSKEKPQIKQEKLSFREPIKPSKHLTFLFLLLLIISFKVIPGRRIGRVKRFSPTIRRSRQKSPTMFVQPSRSVTTLRNYRQSLRKNHVSLVELLL